MATAPNDRIVVGSTRELIRHVAESWRAQYGRSTDEKWAAVQERLDTLEKETASAADVHEIIGNNSWTQRECDVCCDDVEWWVRIGEEPEYESSTVHVCRRCLAQALYTLDAAIGRSPDTQPEAAPNE